MPFRLKQMATPVTKLSELGASWKDYDVIGIDEGQFYSDVSLIGSSFFSY